MRSIALPILFVLTASRAAESTGPELCSDGSTGPARIRCYENALTELRPLVEKDPALLERLARTADDALSASGPASAGVRSELLDLRGQALGRLGRAEEAADALRAAVALDDGTDRLVWLDDEGRASWTAALDPGVGRQERTARALLAAGKADLARALLAHVLASGGEGASQEMWNRSGGGVAPGLDAVPSDLSAAPWYPPLPDFDLRLLDGGSFPFGSARGSVLLIDFWASWCAPCVHELPRVQALAQELRGAGLVVLTVNARETAEAARTGATALHLDVPIGLYDDALDRALRVRSLPTILLVDRAGRIRNRWDAFVPDFDGEVGVKARALLEEKPDANRRRVAVVQAGAGLLEVRWTREVAAPIVGLAPAAGEGQVTRIAAASGDQILLLSANGAIDRRHKLPSGTAGRLREVASRGPARYDLVSFRPGRPELAWIDSIGGAVHSEAAASPVLDAAGVFGATPQTPDGRLVLGTVAGIAVTGKETPASPLSELAGEVRSVAVQGNGPAATVWALDAEGRLRALDAAGHVVREVEVDRTARRIAVTSDGPPGVGVFPRGTRAAVIGRFLPGGRSQAVAATEDGQLVLVDLATGSIPFRARWAGIDELAALDLDGDGRDELVIAADRALTVLGAAAGAPPVRARAGS